MSGSSGSSCGGHVRTFRFRPAVGKKILETRAAELLTGQNYADANVSNLGETLADSIRKELIELQLPRYKFLVQVVIGEQRGQGTRIHTGSVWDVDTDTQVTHYYQNDSLFCQIVVFVVFTYSQI